MHWTSVGLSRVLSRETTPKLYFLRILKVDDPFLKFSNQHWLTWWLDLSRFVVPMACIYALFELWYIQIQRFERHQTCFYCIFITVSLQKYFKWFLVNIEGSKISLFSEPKTTQIILFLSYNRFFWSLRPFLYAYEMEKAYWESRKTMWGTFLL